MSHYYQFNSKLQMLIKIKLNKSSKKRKCIRAMSLSEIENLVKNNTKR